jgi:phage shock protein A
LPQEKEEAMGIISRCTDVVRSNLNAMVAWAGNPQKILRLIIQDMEDTLVKVRSAAVQGIAERKDLERRIEQVRDNMEEWQNKAELAVIKGRDDLANAALQAKLASQRTLRTLEKQLAIITNSLELQSEDMARLQVRLQDAKARERTIGALHRTTRARLKLRRRLFDRRLSNALARFEQLENSLDEIEGKVESYDLGQTRTVRDAIGQLAIESSVSDELAELKMRLSNQIALAPTKA